MFVPYAVRHLGLIGAGVGTVLTMYGVGMVIGALFATRVMGASPSAPWSGLARSPASSPRVVMALTVLVPSPWLAGLELLPARRRADPVGDLDHDACANR